LWSSWGLIVAMRRRDWGREYKKKKKKVRFLVYAYSVNEKK
jgi:hypothetical protein